MERGKEHVISRETESVSWHKVSLAKTLEFKQYRWIIVYTNLIPTLRICLFLTQPFFLSFLAQNLSGPMKNKENKFEDKWKTNLDQNEATQKTKKTFNDNRCCLLL